MTEDMGCVLVALAFFVAIPLIYIWARVRQERSAAANREQRADRIHRLIRTFGRSRSTSALHELDSALRSERIGFVPTLEALFAEASPTLAALVRDPATFGTVEWYFECFAFPAGRMEKVLLWLTSLMNASNEASAVALQRLVNRAMRQAGPAEAEWLYDRVREGLRSRPQDLDLRSLVLHVGRLSYSLQRLDRRLTVYDEQAIANDIAVCIK